METDRFLAEKLMGWNRDDSEPEWWATLKDDNGDVVFFAKDWRPGIFIAQCFKYIVPKMMELGFLFTLTISPDGDCIAQFEKPIFEYGGQHISNNPATSITEAARAALESE